MEEKTAKTTRKKKPAPRKTTPADFIGDLIKQQKKRIEKQKKWKAHLKETMSPKHYQEYLEREKKRKTALAIIAAVAAVLFLLLISTVVRGIGKLFAGHPASAPATVVETETETGSVYEEKDITIGSTGCMLLHSPFISSYADANGNYDYSSVYKFITPYYSTPDFMTCEFEGTLGGPELGYSGYPNFKSPDVIIENIRDSGVDLQMLATNHSYDGLSAAFHRTMEVYEKDGIAYTGMRQTTSDKRYYVADVDGVKIGFMDYVYETTGTGVNLNGIPLEQKDWDLINSFDYDDLDTFYQEAEQNIKDMKADGAQFIVANMHWGLEYHLTESDDQREIAQKLCDLGVDALIGGHPHCLQPIDVFENVADGHQMFCIFSEGNALSNQRTYLMTNEMPTGHTEDGVMVTLFLHQDTAGNVTIKDVDVLPTWVYRFQENGSKYYILPLDDVDGLAKKTGITDLGDDAKNSYERTMEELGDGLAKAKAAFGKNEKGE